MGVGGGESAGMRDGVGMRWARDDHGRPVP